MLKKLSNLGEDRVHGQIASVADRYNAQVYRKIRIADVVDIHGLHSRDLGRYALMAHFDFVVADDGHTPHFALEFDGPGHSSTHDAKKDEICRQANLALFRVNLPTSQSQIGQLSFLNYLVHLWFLALEFEKLRASGDIPYDEPFMISGFLKSDAKHIFDSEFDLLSRARGKINAFCKKEGIGEGVLEHLAMEGLLMRNDNGEYVAFSSFPIEGTKLYGRTILGLKIPHFGLLQGVQFSGQELGQYCMALAIHDLLEELKMFRRGHRHIVRRQDEIQDEIGTLRKCGFSLLVAFSGNDDELAMLAHPNPHSTNRNVARRAD